MPEFEMQIQTAADQLIYSTLRLTALAGGQSIGTGTAFYFRFKAQNGGYVPGLITNKHVIAGADAVQLRVHMRDEAGAFLEEGHSFTLQLGDGVLYHPDAEVDLCMIPPGDMLDFKVGDKRPFSIALGEDNIPTDSDWEGFDSVEGVWMIGCPNGIYDTLNNLPIVRSGITATSPRLPYKGKSEFVVDMACFPGSSGSPIFRAPSPLRFNRVTGNTDFGAEQRGFLMGVLYAGPLITNSGSVVLSSNPRVEVASMMHLGYAIRSTRILGFKPLINAQLAAQGVSLLIP